MNIFVRFKFNIKGSEVGTPHQRYGLSGAVLFLAGMLVAGCMAGSREAHRADEPLRLPAVYTRYLAYPVPSEGISAAFNPPVLRWPVKKGNDVLYDVRLSTDSLFGNGKILQRLNTPWAMFNPHEALAPGKWFWQYRVSGGDWSEVIRFTVEPSAIALVSPTAASFLRQIPSDHPRVLASRADIPELRKLESDADVEAILQDADRALTTVMLTEEDGRPQKVDEDPERNRKLQQDASHRLGGFVFGSLEPLCQAFILTGDNRYKKKALDIAFEVSGWDPAGVSGSGFSDFADARCMLGMALVLDTFYDQLNTSQKAALIKAIHRRADGFYSAWINNQEARVLSGHVWQHILHYFFLTALAVHGEDPAAENWLSYAYELFLARTPILGGTDGGWTEGVSYFRMNMETVVEIPLIIRKYTGFDFINSHPWYTENIEWLVYNIPPGSSADGFGDNTEEVHLPGVHFAAYAQEMAKLTGSRLASWYAEKCKEYEPLNLSDNRILRWIRLVRTRDMVSPPPPEVIGLPMGRVFRDIGLASMHSDPGNTRQNLMVAMRSGPFGCYGHFLSDHNAFNILYGGKRTFFRTGYKVTMKDPHRTQWYQHTKSNNSVLVNGQGQPYSTEAFGWIPRFMQGREIAYALGDASNAYSSEETGEDFGVKKFHRHLILLKPDIIVIFDELESQDDAQWSWLIHSMEEIRIGRDDNAFESEFEEARGVGKLWSSHPVTWALSDTFDVPAVNWRGSKDASGKPKRYENEQWHLTASNENKTDAIRFLAVLQISPDAAGEQITEEADEERTIVRAGKWRITVELDINALPELVIRDDAGQSVFTYSGGALPRIMEQTRGEPREIVAETIYPWYLEQSKLHYHK